MADAIRANLSSVAQRPLPRHALQRHPGTDRTQRSVAQIAGRYQTEQVGGSLNPPPTLQGLARLGDLPIRPNFA